MKSNSLPQEVQELLYQALETEIGGVQVYETAVKCAVNEDLKEEWDKYLEETRNHVQVVTDLIGQLGLDPSGQTPGRLIVREKGLTLVKAMQKALTAGKPKAAQL